MQIKGKTVISWSLRRKKESSFCTGYFVRRNFFNICFLSQCTVYWMQFQNILFYISKIIISYSFLLVSKIIESLQCNNFSYAIAINLGIHHTTFVWIIWVKNFTTADSLQISWIKLLMQILEAVWKFIHIIAVIAWNYVILHFHV